MTENPNASLKSAPLIGQFKGPQNNEPRKPSSETAREQENKSLIEEMLDGDAESSNTKIKSYQDQLEEAGLSIEKARVIRDNMLFNHFHEEEYKIANKLPVTIRTRDYSDVQRAMRRIEAASLQYPISVNDMIAQCNMAASLRRYGNTVFEIKTTREGAQVSEVEASFDKRLDFIMGLPVSVVNRLMVLVQKFDMMISAVFADGAPEDF